MKLYEKMRRRVLTGHYGRTHALTGPDRPAHWANVFHRERHQVTLYQGSKFERIKELHLKRVFVQK